MSLPRIQIGRPQRLAGLLLLVFLLECLWVVSRQELSPADYRYALCGREMWEQPSPLAGYFTSCGNLNGDGTFAYRVAGLPLTAERLVLQAADELRRPENRLYAGSVLSGGLWWVCRRLFGNEGGFFALGLYCFCPTVIRYAVVPNNEVLAMWGLYGLVYAAMGVAHAMQGPRRKWKPRILLLVLALGLTAIAHLLAVLLGFVAAFAFLFYLAERRRSYVMQLLIFSALGALLVVFASFAFRLAPFSYVFTGGAGRFWFSLDAARAFFSDMVNAPIAIATAVAAVLYLGVRRSRYFGNTAPLLMLLVLFALRTTQVMSYPWLWALPFLFTFVGGVFADVLETRQRKLFLGLTGSILALQMVLCAVALPELAR
jgi:hypothetical protein